MILVIKLRRKDKQEIEERLKMFNNLLDEDPYIQQKKAEGLAEGEMRGEAKGEVKGEAKGLREAIITTIEVRFPPLAELAQKRVAQIKKPDALRLLLRQVNAAPDEAAVRLILDLLAA